MYLTLFLAQGCLAGLLSRPIQRQRVHGGLLSSANSLCGYLQIRHAQLMPDASKH